MATTVYQPSTPQTKWRAGTPQTNTGRRGNFMIVSVLSTDYYQTPVSASENGVAVNPTTLPVAYAFRLPGTAPVTADWKTGSWDLGLNGTYLAQVLLGPGSGAVGLARGRYQVWLRVTDNPEVPIWPLGLLEVR